MVVVSKPNPADGVAEDNSVLHSVGGVLNPVQIASNKLAGSLAELATTPLITRVGEPCTEP